MWLLVILVNLIIVIAQSNESYVIVVYKININNQLSLKIWCCNIVICYHTATIVKYSININIMAIRYKLRLLLTIINYCQEQKSTNETSNRSNKLKQCHFIIFVFVWQRFELTELSKFLVLQFKLFSKCIYNSFEIVVIKHIYFIYQIVAKWY